MGSDLGRSVGVDTVETDIPARLDRLPWGRFHTLVIVALGITWIFDGLEVTLAGALTGALKESPTLRFSNTDIGLASSAYLAGAVLGAVFFGWLTDRLGRKKLFFITLAVYLTATAATAFSWSFWSFCLFRFLTGAGIGGEYTAINSTIQELIPARVRGWTDLVINGSFWVGAALGAAGSIVLLDPHDLRARSGMAHRILHRRRARPRDPGHAAVDSGKPALAHDTWPSQGSRSDRRRHRNELCERRRQARHHGAAACAPACAQPYALARGVRHPAQRAPAAGAGRPDPDDCTGLLLQRDLLHLRADPDRFLRDQGGEHRLVHAALRGW